MSTEPRDTLPPWASAMEDRLRELIEDKFSELKAALVTTIEGLLETSHRVARIESSRPTERPAATGAE